MSDQNPSIMLNGYEPIGAPAVGNEEGRRVTSELKRRVENWKNINPKFIGTLLLYDSLTIQPPGRSQPKPYYAYLFDNIFIVCKDERSHGTSSSRSKHVSSNHDSKLRLMGRILASDIDDLELSEDSESHICTMLWHGEGQEHVLSIHFATPSQMTLWVSALKEVRAAYRNANCLKRRERASASF